jgi:hypothetical protein
MTRPPALIAFREIREAPYLAFGESAPVAFNGYLRKAWRTSFS